MLWPPDAKSQLTRKNPDVGKNYRQQYKGMTADETVGCNHWFIGLEFKQVPGFGEEQGSLACCSPWVAKSRTQLSDWTITMVMKGGVLRCISGKYLDWFESTVHTNLDVYFTSKVSGKKKECYRGSSYHLRKYIHYSEQNVLRNMNVKSASDEASDWNEEHEIWDWRENYPCYKWQKT